MADTTVATPPRRRRGWLKKIGWICGVLILLLVVAYFVGTSSAFFKGVILPRVSKSIHADVTVSDASISPFRQVVLRNLKVQSSGPEPLVSAPEVRLRYSLFDIIGGNIHVDEVTIVSPQVVLIENPDGTSNLDPLLKSEQKKPAETKPREPGKPSKPMQIDLKKLALTDATVRRVKNYAGGNRDVTELSHVNITLDGFKNGQAGKLLLSAEAKVENNPPKAPSGALKAKVNGNFVFSLTPDLKPASVKGNTRLDITQATGAMADLAALGGDLDCEITPTEVKQVALRFQKNNARLGEVRVSGPFDAAKTEGRLRVEIVSIDKAVLNLAGAKNGIDFGSTTINSTNDIQVAKLGTAVTASGQLNLNRLQITRTNQTSPPLDLRVDYDVTLDRTAENAVLRALAVDGTQKGNRVLRAELSSPMTVAWGKNAGNAIGDSTLNFSVTGLDLADWKPFVGEVAPAGTVNLNAKLLSQRDGKQLTFDLDSKVENLTAGSGTNQITQATITVQLHGQSPDLNQFNLTEYKLQLARQNQSLLSVTGSGMYDLTNQTADVQFALQATLARLIAALSRPDIALSSGTVDLKGHVIQKQATQNLTGNLVVADLTGKVGKNDFRGFGAIMDLDVSATPQLAQIRKANGKVTEGSNAGGSFEVSGSYNPTSKVGQITAKLTDFNQYGLRAFLEPLLADKRLASIAINASATTQYNPEGDSSIKADLQVTNLVVSDPKNQFPTTPLEARMQVDTSLRKQVAEVRQLSVTLTPTARAKNELRLQGRVDMTQTNAYQGNLQLAADSLDVTRYYDLFAGEKKAEAPSAKPTRGTSSPSTTSTTAEPEKEPDAMSLPFRNFTAGVNIGKFYLREVEITNLQTTVKIDGGHLVLNPFNLALNGAPVTASADLDLGVAGYKYDTSLSLQSVPLAPLVNSFQPERKGMIGGTVTAQAKISGKGVTGVNLQKNLAGQFDVGSTNLNLAVENIENRVIRLIVEVVSSIPDLVKNPLGAGASLLQGATGLKGGLSDELKRSPVDAILARGTAGSGRVELQQSAIQSPAFRAEAVGTITLAPVLTNSTLQLPVSILLERSVAEKANLLPGDTPTNAKYAKLPDFLTIKGTVGDPKKDYNKAALAGITAKGISAIPGLGGKNTQGVLGGLGNLLTGQQSAGTNVAPGSTTNPPPARAPANDLLNQLLKPKKK